MFIQNRRGRGSLEVIFAFEVQIKFTNPDVSTFIYLPVGKLSRLKNTTLEEGLRR